MSKDIRAMIWYTFLIGTPGILLYAYALGWALAVTTHG